MIIERRMPTGSEPTFSVVLLGFGGAEHEVGGTLGQTTTNTRERAMSKQERGSDERSPSLRGEAAEKAIFFLQSWKECHRLREQLDKQCGSKLQAI